MLERTPKAALILLLGVVMLAGCSFKFVYNQLDWIIASRVDDLISLNDGQAQDFERRVDHLLAWHRDTQLSAYDQTLEQFVHRVEDGIDREDVIFGMLAVEGHWQVLKERASSTIANSLVSLSPDQVDELFSNLAERNEEYRQEHVGLSDREQVEQRIDRMEAMFERWVGDVNDQQRNVFAYYAERFKPVHALRLEYRRQWQQRLRSVIDSSLDTHAKLDRLNGLLGHPRRYRPAPYTEALEHNRGKIVELIVMLDRTLTPEQRRQLVATLRDYQNMFAELSGARRS